MNPRSGKGEPDTSALAREARRRGLAIHLLGPGDDVRSIARSAQGTVGMACGDGSLGAVARVSVEHRDASSALDAFDSGRELRIDVGRVGTRVFINNVSFGLYADLVHRREAHPLMARSCSSPTNAYDIHVFDLGARARLDEGKLHVYVAEDWLPHTWDERVTEYVMIERPPALRAAVDGEPVELGQRVELGIEPRALRILVP